MMTIASHVHCAFVLLILLFPALSCYYFFFQNQNLRSFFLDFHLICVSGNSERAKGEKYNDLHFVEEALGSIEDLVQDMGHNNAP